MFRLPQKVKNEIKNFNDSLTDMLQGRISAARFTGVRVPWGIYSHRGGQVFMTRIRIPAGEITADQLRTIATVAKSYGSGLVHITTRQDIQVHGVKLADTIKVIEHLAKFDLSPRGGGGNTVRNVTVCPRAGVCADEYFDVREAAIALTEFLLQDDVSFNLPRKFKIGFSGCAKDCAGCLVQDVGFLARVKNGQSGFQVFAGGGMGAQSALGYELEPFLPLEELGLCVSAVRNVFYRQGERKNKHHNRLRFLIGDMGFDAFKDLYSKEKGKLLATEHIQLRKIEFPLFGNGEDDGVAKSSDPQFQEFLSENVYSQKQDGFVSLAVRIPRGDLPAEKIEELADILVRFPESRLRLSQHQNVIFVNVKKKVLSSFYNQVKQFSEEYAHPNTLTDIVCCKGAQTCNLGLCNSPGLSEELERVLTEQFKGTAVFKRVDIKINGCPNSCGQHPLGLIALHGLSRRVHSRPAPFYKLLLGGKKAAKETRLAKDTGIVLPAKSVPRFLVDFLRGINKELEETTDIDEYMVGKGLVLAREIAPRYTFIPSYEENKDFYIDWGKTEEFSLSGLGPGECGAGVLDMIDADLAEAKVSLELVRQNKNVADLKKALYYTSRALLIVKGVDPHSEEEAIDSFVEKFIREGIALEWCQDLKERFISLSGDLNAREFEEARLYAEQFYQHVQELYQSMDSTFQFPKAAQRDSEKIPPEISGKTVLDLKGVACPMNYVKAKLFLESRQIGETIVIYLDEGEPIQNVPKSLENDGEKILRIEKRDGFYEVHVKKEK